MKKLLKYERYDHGTQGEEIERVIEILPKGFDWRGTDLYFYQFENRKKINELGHIFSR